MIKVYGEDVDDPEKFWTMTDKINDLGMRVVVKQNKLTMTLYISVSKDGVQQVYLLSKYNHSSLYSQIALAEYQVGYLLHCREALKNEGAEETHG